MIEAVVVVEEEALEGETEVVVVAVEVVLEVVIEVVVVAGVEALEEDEVRQGVVDEVHQVVVAADVELQEAEAHLEVVEEEELEEEATSLSNLTDIPVSLSPKERNTYSLPRISYLVKQSTEKRESVSKVPHKKQMELLKRQSTEFGTLSDPN